MTEIYHLNRAIEEKAINFSFSIKSVVTTCMVKKTEKI